MSGLCIKFGYYPHHCDIRAGGISLLDAPDREQSVVDVEASETIYEDWLYAPLQRRLDFMSGQITTLPYSARVFPSPKTHVLTHADADGVEHLEFLVWCVAFFTGMRLTTTEAGFLDATPIKPGKLTDFLLSGCSLGDAIALAESFWRQHREDRRKIQRVIGTIASTFR